MQLQLYETFCIEGIILLSQLLLQIDTCALEVGATSKTVGGSMAQLLTAAAQVFWHFYLQFHTIR